MKKNKFIHTLKELAKLNQIHSYETNYQRYLSPIYKYPIPNYDVYAITTKLPEVKLVIMVFYDPKKPSIIRRLKFMFQLTKIEHRVKEFESSFLTGIYFNNYILGISVDRDSYSRNNDLKNLIIRLTSINSVNYYINNRSWDSLKSVSAEEHFCLLERQKNLSLKNRP